MNPLSIRKTLAGKHILLTGATGFLGKFWLVTILDLIPEIGRVSVLMRGKSRMPADKRFDDMVNHSPIFEHLHLKHGPELSRFISERVDVVEGSIDRKMFGIAPDRLKSLQENCDLIINCAGLTDFNPDLRMSFKTNVQGALNAAELAQSLKKSPQLLHVSTCFVAGRREGYIDEVVVDTECPKGLDYDVEAEYQWVLDSLNKLEDSFSLPADASSKRIRIRDLRLRRDSIKLGKDRAAYWGWPNIYTYMKHMAEAMLVQRFPELSMSMFRPAIVETSVRYLPGWNEGFNGSGPFAYLLKGWFRQIPAAIDNPFDIVPVDLVCFGMTNAAAAMLSGRAKPAYHCGTTHLNRLTIDRATELTGLAHRTHLRKNGRRFTDRFLKSRFEGIAQPDDTVWSMENIRDAARTLSRSLRNSPDWLPQFAKDKCQDWAYEFDRMDRALKPVEAMLDAFSPFTRDTWQVFLCQNLKDLKVEEPEFQFNPDAAIEWRDYWLHVQMPALRKWCFPKYAGTEIPRYTPEHTFQWDASLTNPAAASKTVTNIVGQGVVKQ